MPKPIKAKIDVTKILKEHLFIGNKGTYLDVAIWPNKNGPSDRGETHYIVQEISREARDRGERGPIIGNLTIPDDAPPPPRQQPQRPPVQRPKPSADPDLDAPPEKLPF